MSGHLRSLLRFPRLVLGMALILGPESFAQNNSDLVNLPFTGHYRKDAKTSFVKGSTAELSYEHFASIAEFLKTVPSDASMRADFPNITSKDFPRTKDESRNVEVDAFIYGAKLEGDNDLHVVIANSTNSSDTVFLNTELSGLPEDEGEDFDTLIAARTKFVTLFPTQNFQSGSYAKLGLKHVRIRGSLIFDADHYPGCATCPGPKDAKPKTVWEIHPITGIDLLSGSSTPGSHTQPHRPRHPRHKTTG